MKQRKNVLHFKKQYDGKWIALTVDNSVVGYSKSLVTLTKKMAGRKVTYMKAMNPETVFAFWF
jgi:hypothetical protein